MTEAGDVPCPPTDISAEPVPHWERRYPGRYCYELEALQSAGIVPEVDPDALNAGRLVLTFDWPRNSGAVLRLKAVYPDSFPHLRPQVFLLSGLDPSPGRHCSPVEGNLCLLGRDSRQWVPSWTLHRLLAEQLENTLSEVGEEDPQGEPSEYWWNSLNPSGSFCLIDSAWDLGGFREGTLSLRYVPCGEKTENQGNEKIRLPIIKAFVFEVHGMDQTVVHRWDGPLPPDLSAATRTLHVPWVRLDETLLPEPDLFEQLEQLRRNHSRLQQNRLHNYQHRLSFDFSAIVHRSELGFNQLGLGWMLFMRFGHSEAFNEKTRRRKRKEPPRITTLPVLRGGAGDIGYRVPAVRLLRAKRILLVGTGAVGAPIAVELARNGCGTLHLIEHDTVEPGNTVRWPLGATAWGRHKLDALKEFLQQEYPGTTVHAHRHCLGRVSFGTEQTGDDTVLNSVTTDVDLVIDGSASHGVTTLLAEQCRQVGIPLITLFATPSLEGGAVIRHAGDGGCPNCLEHAWHNNDIPSPPGRDSEDDLAQPPGCAERTFIGAGYDLQELSLQSVRLSVETLWSKTTTDSVVHTLSFIDDHGHRCPPRWRVDPLPKHSRCHCQR